MIAYGWKRKKLSIIYFVLFFILVIVSALKGLGMNTSGINIILLISIYLLLVVLSIYFGFIIKNFPELGGSTHRLTYFTQPNNINVKTSYKGNKAIVMGIASIFFGTICLYWLLFM